MAHTIKDKLLLLAGAAVVVIAALGYQLFFSNTDDGVIGDYHAHADFKVYLDATQPYNFSQEKYRSVAPGANSTANETKKLLSNFVHLHDGDGRVVHFHLKGITMGYFFRTIGMKFNSTCFATDLNETYCNSEANTLKFFVNERESDQFDKYVPNDLDRIMISFGSETPEQLQEQSASVSNVACIQSRKCPERGTPKPEDSCTTGGTGCLPEPSHGQ